MNINEVLDEALKNISESKEAAKHMNMRINDFCEPYKKQLDKQIIRRCRDYSLYKGNGWTNGDPLSISPAVTKTGKKVISDKISGVCVKLAQIIDDLRDTGTLDDFEDYSTALKAIGINISIQNKTAIVNDVAEFRDMITDIKGYQHAINSNNEEFEESLSTEAEELNFCPKNKFKNVATFYYRKSEGKDIEDAVQDKLLETGLYENALVYVQENVADEV